MTALLRMPGGVAVGRAFAAQRRTAGLARPQMDPVVADLDALFALIAFRVFDKREKEKRGRCGIMMVTRPSWVVRLEIPKGKPLTKSVTLTQVSPGLLSSCHHTQPKRYPALVLADLIESMYKVSGHMSCPCGHATVPSTACACLK